MKTSGLGRFSVGEINQNPWLLVGVLLDASLQVEQLEFLEVPSSVKKSKHGLNVGFWKEDGTIIISKSKGFHAKSGQNHLIPHILLGICLKTSWLTWTSSFP